MLFRTIAIAALFVLSTASAQAAKVCAWMVEENKSIEDDPGEFERHLTLWLESDGEVDFTYKIGGQGIVTPGSVGNSPGSGTFSLHPGEKKTPWGYGQTLNPPGKIDVTVELHKTPADIFSNAPTPLYAKFAFQRNVPANEKSPPPIFMKKQCANVPNSAP